MTTVGEFHTAAMLCPEHGKTHSGKYLLVDQTWCDACEKDS